jgi:hypothetical protein
VAGKAVLITVAVPLPVVAGVAQSTASPARLSNAAPPGPYAGSVEARGRAELAKGAAADRRVLRGRGLDLQRDALGGPGAALDGDRVAGR